MQGLDDSFLRPCTVHVCMCEGVVTYRALMIAFSDPVQYMYVCVRVWLHTGCEGVVTLMIAFSDPIQYMYVCVRVWLHAGP